MSSRKIIDAHTHVYPQYADMAVQVMDLCGVESVITLEWHDGFGSVLKEHLEIFNSYPGRFIVFGNIDWRRINEKGFAAAAAAQMERDVAAGMRGAKIYKALGLEYRNTAGELWRIDDEAFNPIWEKAGELGIPVLIHTADPATFWQPVDDNNFWNNVLYGEYEWWSYNGKDYPNRTELITARNRMIARHPHTTFICPHMGSNADDLTAAGADLDALPNIYYDFSARIPVMGFTLERAKRSRDFFIKHQDRILLGTDIIYDDIHVPTGIQAQCLNQPEESPLQGVDPEQKYIESTTEFFQSHIDFLTTDKVQKNPPFKRNRKGFSITGLNLPMHACEKILYTNVLKLIQYFSILL